MRVTNRQLSNIVRQSLGDNTTKLLKAQEKVATRKSVNRPSDDPEAMGRILGYRTTLSSIEQYSRNIDQAKIGIEYSEMQLEEVCDQLRTAKGLLSMDPGSADEAVRQQTADDVQDIYDQLLAIANTKLGDNYIFAGHQTDTEPFADCAEATCTAASELTGGEHFTLGSDYYVWYTKDGTGDDPAPAGRAIGIEVAINAGDDAEAVARLTAAAIKDHGGGLVFESSATLGDAARVQIEMVPDGTSPEIAEIDTGFTLHTAKYNGDDGDLNFMVSNTLKIKGNATGADVFTGTGRPDGTNVFDTLKALKDALEAPTYVSARVSELKEDLTKGFDQVQSSAVDLSVAYTRLESTENYWGRFKLSVENMLSKTEDADFAEAIVELQIQQTAYEAALSASASLFDKSLMDFLR